MAVSDTLRGRWTYVRGSSRNRLRDLLAQLGDVDLFVHDSLHTGRNVRFELTSVWPALRSGGAVVVDDVELNLGFHAFVHAVGPRAWFVAPHTDARGFWGVAVK
jgi:hypothetical protein